MSHIFATISLGKVISRVMDSHRVNVDPDSAFHFNADPDPNPAPHQSDGNLRPQVYKRHVEHPGFHCERPGLYIEPLKLLNFDFNADPNPDPAPVQSDRNLRPQLYSIDPPGLYFEPLGTSIVSVHGSIWSLNFDLKRIRIQFPKIMRIRIHNPVNKNADPDPA
jgi:hypothetical protein